MGWCLMNEIAEWWSKVPCESQHGTAERGSLAWSDEVTDQRYFVQHHILRFADFPSWRGKKVLEIGCGIGTDTLEFCRSGADVYAGDVSEKSVEIAYHRALLHKAEFQRLPWIHVVNAEEWLPFGPFDLVWSFGVLHHTPHPEKVLNRVHEVLKDDGELRIMLYARWSWKKLMGHQPEAQAGCPLVKWYSKNEAVDLLESCGFKVVSIEKTHIFPWRVDEYRQHRFVKAFPWNICPRWLFKWLETKLGHHLLIVAVKA